MAKWSRRTDSGSWLPVRTLHAGPNPKYFGFERGVTYYNLLSDQFTGLNAIVIPGTLRSIIELSF